MLPDANELVATLKKAAIEAVEAAKPVNVYFGEVVSASPLKINVEQKMILSEKQLVLSRNVTNFQMPIEIQLSLEPALTEHSHIVSGKDENKDSTDLICSSVNLKHSHAISGGSRITICNSLVVGDEVILIRQQGGQKFIVWDRIGG